MILTEYRIRAIIGESIRDFLFEDTFNQKKREMIRKLKEQGMSQTEIDRYMHDEGIYKIRNEINLETEMPLTDKRCIMRRKPCTYAIVEYRPLRGTVEFAFDYGGGRSRKIAKVDVVKHKDKTFSPLWSTLDIYNSYDRESLLNVFGKQMKNLGWRGSADENGRWNDDITL